MTMPGERSASNARQSHSRRVIRFCILAGWILLICFVARVAFLGSIGADIRAFQTAYCAGFLGYFLLLWVILRTSQAAGIGAWRWWLMGCIGLRLLPLAVDPSDDAYRYVWEGRVQHAGFNPFGHPPDDPQLADLRDDGWGKINHPDYPAIYGPVSQLQFLAAAAICPSVYTVKLMHVVWDVFVMVVLAACLRGLGRRPHGAVLYSLCPPVLASFAIEGHVDSLMLLFMAVAVWAVVAKRKNLAGVMLGLAMATKIVLLVLLPWFLKRCRREAILAVVVATLCYLPYLSAGTGVFSSLLRFSSGAPSFSVLAVFSVTSLGTVATHVAAALLLAAILIALAWRRHDFTDYGAAAMGTLLLLMPIVHYWYLSWVLIWLPFGARARWIVAALAMILYFEAELRRETVGVWSMPDWAPVVVWGTFGLAWLGEVVVARRGRRPKQPEMSRTVPAP
ncbi:MAG: DUF2029 domain-containing protein [Phycisphaerales bacterium]|nr:MAG: DUF2029 domain-containing protein [Phycisphaerales bacterium]